MTIIGGKLARYFGMRFLGAVLLTFVGVFMLVALLDYIEMMRRAATCRMSRRCWSPRRRCFACRR